MRSSREGGCVGAATGVSSKGGLRRDPRDQEPDASGGSALLPGGQRDHKEKAQRLQQGKSTEPTDAKRCQNFETKENQGSQLNQSEGQASEHGGNREGHGRESLEGQGSTQKQLPPQPTRGQGRDGLRKVD